MNPSNFQNGAHCTTGDDTGTFGSWLHEYETPCERNFNRVLQGAVVQRDALIILRHGLFHRFSGCCTDFTRFTVTKTYATVTIAYYSQSCEGKYDRSPTVLLRFYRDRLFLRQFASLFSM